MYYIYLFIIEREREILSEKEGLKSLNQHKTCGYMQNACREYEHYVLCLGVWRNVPWFSFGLSIFPVNPRCKEVGEAKGETGAHPRLTLTYQTCVWTWDCCRGTPALWCLPQEIVWFCWHVTAGYSQCWREKHSAVPSPALTCNLLELLGHCRILYCDSGTVMSEATQTVHTTAYNSVNILPASMLNAIPFLWKCSKNSRTTLCFKGQNVTAWKAEALGRVISI